MQESRNPSLPYLLGLQGHKPSAYSCTYLILGEQGLRCLRRQTHCLHLTRDSNLRTLGCKLSTLTIASLIICKKKERKKEMVVEGLNWIQDGGVIAVTCGWWVTWTLSPYKGSPQMVLCLVIDYNARYKGKSNLNARRDASDTPHLGMATWCMRVEIPLLNRLMRLTCSL